MAKLPKPVKRFEIPIYGGEVLLYKDQKEFWKAYAFLGGRQEYDSPKSGEAAHLQSDEGMNIFLVGWYSGTLSTLVHEITHVMVFLFEHVGIDPRDSNGEVAAYLVGYLIDKLHPTT
jgi:hypothetical protein